KVERSSSVMAFGAVPFRSLEDLRGLRNGLYGANPTHNRLRRTVTCARGFSRPLRDRARVSARAPRIGEGERDQALRHRALAQAGAQFAGRAFACASPSAGNIMA